jgi:tetratricopeptide (TPR) repeat protein
LAAEPQGNSEQRDLMLTNRYIAQAYLSQRAVEKAMRAYEEEIIPIAVRLLEQNTQSDGSIDMRSRRDLCIAQREFGELLLMHGDAPAAVKSLAEAYQRIESFLEDHPDDTTALRDYGRCGASLAGALIENEQYDQAKAMIATVQVKLKSDSGTWSTQERDQVLAYCQTLLEAIPAAEDAPDQ